MRSHYVRMNLKAVFCITLVLLLGAGTALAQQQVNLSAGGTSLTLPDGSSVPMWGYSCGALVQNSTATCAKLNPTATGWSPVIITVPTGSDLKITLTNNLTFAGNNIPTSLTIVGQLGGGLGTTASVVPSPQHISQPPTWPITNSGPEFNPPPQGPRVQSFSTEVVVGTPTDLTWTAPRPGTYLLESGTHPSIQGPMGLYGIVVVTAAPTATGTTENAGTAYPNVSYNADLALLLSEIDPAQNRAVNTAVTTAGFKESAIYAMNLKAGPVVSLNLFNPGSGYTAAPTVSIAPPPCVINGSTCVQATATADIDTDSTSPTYRQVTGLTLVTGGNGYNSDPAVTITGNAQAQASLALGTALAACSDGALACYPPAVNYTPLYYLVNGQAFDKTNAPNSLFPVSVPTGINAVTGNVLVRLVNAGLRMHVPSIVGAVTGASSAPGFALIAEDGNVLPGVPRVQNEVFMAAGKTYDVMINAPAAGGTALPIFDRELSLSGNAFARDAGMLAYIGVNGNGVPSGTTALGAAKAVADTYKVVCPTATACNALTISDLDHGVIANDFNVYGVKVSIAPLHGSVDLRTDGTFTYTATGNSWATDSFTYCGNGVPGPTGAACAVVSLGKAIIEAGSGIALADDSYTSNVATTLSIKPPGVLENDVDGAHYPLTIASVAAGTVTGTTHIGSCGNPAVAPCVSVDPNGGFNAIVTGAGLYSFSYKAKNSQGTTSANAANVVLNFPAANGPTVTVLDGADHKTVISDYRWVIEEDRTFYVDPACTTNPLPAGCPTVNGAGTPPVFGTNFHTSNMPLVATGCTGPLSCESGQSVGGQAVVCDEGNGVCRAGDMHDTLDPKQVHLDPTKRYYISILPGDAANPFIGGNASAPARCAVGAYNPDGSLNTDCGHGMGGAPIAKGQTSVTVLTVPSPYPPAKLTVFVFQDDWPLNGEHDAGGGLDVLAPQEAGLGGFQITLFDDAGGTGDATGQPTYDMFNMPLTNSLAGTIDPVTGLDACPISTQVTQNTQSGDGSQAGIVGMIVTCPKYESDGSTLSPLAGQAVVNNLYQGRYGVVATPNADRIARGEEWLQTNTLDGQKAHDSFMRIGEPAYFQEFGPAGYHVTIGFANPKIINDRLPEVCATASNCNNEVKGFVTTARMSRTPDERLYGSGTRDSYAFTQCYVSMGDPEGEEFAFTKCDSDGNFDFTGIPAGNWKLTIFDQWNDQVVDGISMPVGLAGANGATLDLKEIAAHQWQQNIYTRSFIDNNGDGVSTKDTKGVPCTAPNTPQGCNANYGNDTEPGLALVATNIRFRDGSFSNFNNTDLNGYAGFNEVFPLFNWYTIETDSTRYKTTGVHVVYDAGGPTDGTDACGPSDGSGNRPCGSSSIAQNFANTYEANNLPKELSVPGAVYCAEGADCSTSAASFAAGTPIRSDTTNHSTGRIDPPFWFGSYGWQGFAGQNSFLEFGKKPFAAGETGGIRGHVVYASTRPFDDPQLLLQLSWEPLVPHVRVNLYKEDVAADGTQSLKLIDYTETSSFDDWAQGFRTDGKPNMNCPGQSATDLFFFGLKDQPNYLDWYNSQHGGAPFTALPYDSQYKCYDGLHNWNQLEPAPYDGMYSFPSVTSLNPTTGKPAGTNCDPTVCVPNTFDPSDKYRAGTPMLPPGKYVVEVVVPPGYELVKEEDKNILIGDNYIAPVTQQFAGLGNIFIMPDQAEINSLYNGTNPQDPTKTLGVIPRHEGDTGSVESFWPCVGAQRTVPDFISLFPGSAEVSPFAGATRNLCDRKEVVLEEQSSALAKFYIFTSTHIAAHYTGVITDDFTAEFDPFSPQFGEKFAPAYLPVSLKDWTGNEIARTYSDEFGAYNGLSYSTWEVNPPNPTGYGPTMMVTCMNDRGSDVAPDPFYQPGYSQFCYELPFMPGQTGYFDTPVVPTSAFAGAGYQNPDCSYPDATPAIASVTGNDGVAGPWLLASGTGHTLTINALGDQVVTNNAYSGPAASTAPFNNKTVTRHYGFGATAGTVTVGGVALTNVSWSDTVITGDVPDGVPACAVQQQPLYGGSTAQCGQLLITAANGKQSVDAVTVTIGGKKPTVLGAAQTIQNAIDTAKPGDMIIVPAGHYNEMVLMWKPVRLQGVGAASSIIDANTQPAGKLDPWRKQVVCLFGLTPDGRPTSVAYPGCDHAADWPGFSGGPEFPTMIVDRVPMEGILGWDTSVNGNLAEQLIEPSLMGAYEGAAITVLGKGVKIPKGSADPYGNGTTESAFPANTTLLSASNCNGSYPTNFYCNPSSIDGLSLTNSSQGGGGIFVHAWGHRIQIANNRIHNNTGTLSGGITIGQGEHVDVTLAGDTNTVPPGSCETSNVTNLSLPFCYNYRVNIHNNAVTLNSSIGDELFSSTPAGAGGVSLCNGADYYNFNYNWVCGNLSSGDGGGVAHIGFSKNGNISHNTILFNQSTNPTVATNGGGLLIMGAPDPDPACGSVNDQDCVADPSTITPSDGTGPGLVIDANLILGNSADSGSGGGLRLQDVNGTDVVNFPHGASSSNNDPLAAHCTAASLSGCRWNTVTITNNIIANNVAGWDGAGVSLQDALLVNVVNNTIVSNDSTASSGVLFQSLFAPLASSQGSNCTANNGSQSCPQVAGLVSVTNSAVLSANLPSSLTCPPNHGTTGNNPSCKHYSVPLLANDVIWKNRSFFIGVTVPNGTGTTGQQSTVALLNSFSGTAVPSQPTADSTMPNGNGVIINGGTGACTTNAMYWEIGVRGDTAPNADNGKLSPMYSVLTDASDYPAANNNTGSDPTVVSQYCNGSRVPPEFATSPFLVIPGTNEVNALPTPVFSLAPAATVDEGNNWVNMIWGPISLTHPIGGTPLGNYAPASGSPAIDYIPSGASTYAVAPAFDFFGAQRKTAGNPSVDAGAVEVQGLTHPVLNSISPTSGFRGNNYNVTLTGTGLTGTTLINGATGITVTNLTVVDDLHVTATFAIPANASTGARNISVTTPNGNSNTVQFSVQNPPTPTLNSINPPSGVRGTSVSVALTGSNFTTNGSSINFPGSTGITVTGLTVVDSGHITAVFVIANNASLGTHNVRVTTSGGGNSTTVPFTVRGATLTISAPNPALNGGGTNTKNGVITVTNTATGATSGPFTFTAAPTIAKTSGTGNGTFSITGGTCVNGYVIAPGGNCSINVSYSGQTNTSTANGRVTVTGTGLATASQNGATFPAN